MKKKYRLIIFFGVFCCLQQYSIAQIGINTDNIQNNLLLQIDAKGNNPKSGVVNPEQALDDFAISNDGKVGIGTLDPQVKLHIVTGGTASNPNPQFRLEDGEQAQSKVLTSNAQGVGYWDNYVPGAVIGNFNSNGVNISSAESALRNTNTKIRLAPGMWAIFYTLIVETNKNVGISKGNRVVVKTSIADSATLSSNSLFATPSPDIVNTSDYHESIVWVEGRSVLIGRYIINNTDASDKDYYIIAGAVANPLNIPPLNILDVGKGRDGSSLFAFRVTE